MKLDELIILISEQTGTAVNQTMLADSLGITRQTISNRIKNASEVTVSELKRVEEYFHINVLNPISDITYIDYYSDVFASCGNGTLVFSDEKTKLAIPVSMINNFSQNKTYSMINASGNSMAPTIDNGDRLIVEHWDGNQIQDDKIYVFCYNNEVFVKRLSKNLDEIIIKSDNSEYRVRTISGKSVEELVLVGKIIATFKQLG